ncbi:MAG: hypothetical protein K0Q57_127 [Gammaproteobacteria bacterium]|jgi:hypothetical protein|nr:hypothetical protein [Gammaproteobacteria bacterium]
MKQVFCTLFDSFYLSRGLAMYESLLKHMPEAYLYVFAFDQRCYDNLSKMNLPNMKVITLAEFEDTELLKIKPTRSRGEYCWTCTPSIILYVLDKFNEAACTYVDADLYFFSTPEPLFSELGDQSVSIISHRYTPEYDQAKTSGKYCVQFMTFKNTEPGLKVLKWWRDACIEWCYARKEDGKFGDQKYLDDWPSRFDGVCELENLGGGVAPWNVQQYEFYLADDQLFGKERLSNTIFPVIFYHFHDFRFLKNDRLDLAPYKLNKQIISLIYLPYVKHLEKIAQVLLAKQPGFNANMPLKASWSFKKLLKVLLRKLEGRYNVCNRKDLDASTCQTS